ncbi:hypothetical protein J6590_058337 [Homalodisca vitripennis]|nr:hypothetical protein J6590_058337 [Homalodisca vitripennis]
MPDATLRGRNLIFAKITDKRNWIVAKIAENRRLIDVKITDNWNLIVAKTTDKRNWIVAKIAENRRLIDVKITDNWNLIVAKTTDKRNWIVAKIVEHSNFIDAKITVICRAVTRRYCATITAVAACQGHANVECHVDLFVAQSHPLAGTVSQSWQKCSLFRCNIVENHGYSWRDIATKCECAYLTYGMKVGLGGQSRCWHWKLEGIRSIGVYLALVKTIAFGVHPQFVSTSVSAACCLSHSLDALLP